LTWVFKRPAQLSDGAVILGVRAYVYRDAVQQMKQKSGFMAEIAGSPQIRNR
jgi:hypothetical protein